jgi:glucose-6-phosphate 1-dehydrogenase
MFPVVGQAGGRGKLLVTAGQELGRHGLAHGARVVYERPFGTSPGSFRELDRVVHSVLDEQQVYRIDHFLGKEATQDLHLLRFANGSSAAFWNRDHVESVQIDVPETLGISDRAQFYDVTGAVLDMLVTHLFQVAAEVAMEPRPAWMRWACRRPGRRSSAASGRWTRRRSCWGSGPGSTGGSCPPEPAGGRRRDA